MSKKYRSITTPDVEHMGPQYITEILISRQEYFRGRRKLPPGWWRGNTDLSKRFKQTLFWVRAFLKVHSEEATINALLSQEGKSICSTANDKLSELVKKHEAMIKAQNDTSNVLPEVKEPNKSGMTQYGNKTRISKLRELDE